MEKATVFAQRCLNAARSTKTIYVMGGWGQPMTDANKAYFIKNYSFNQKTDRKAAIQAASNDTFAFDCICFIKSMLDGFSGDLSQQFGGATYGKPCPDITIKSLLETCTSISTDINTVTIGEYLVYSDYSHCGIYVGNGQVAECTYRWKDGVQITRIDQAERTGLWKYHGKLTKFLDYSNVNPAPVSIKQELQACIAQMSKCLEQMNKLVEKL
jgi:hypothetical protein